MRYRFVSSILLILFMLYTAGCATPTGTPDVDTTVPADQVEIQFLFEDFDYSSSEEMSANGWIVRSGMGWPGVTGASFRPNNVSFVEYPAQPGNRLLRMTSSTDGTRENTYQTQICHQRKYLDGTYAARVRFSDEPVSGVDGDQIVQTFYMITPYDRPLNPDFSEMDFEYLPNGGGAALRPPCTSPPGRPCRSSRGTRITSANPCRAARRAGIHWSCRSWAEPSVILWMGI